MISTTGTTIEHYLEWVRIEVEKRQWGKVSIDFTICNGQVTRVDRGAIDTDQFQLKSRS